MKMIDHFFNKNSKLDPYEVAEDIGALQKMPKDPDGNISLELKKKIKVTDDTFIFRFVFPRMDYVFGLPIGKHVVFQVRMKAPGDDEEDDH